MKKTKLTRSLMAACSIVALSAVMYGCVHSGDGGPAATALSLSDAQMGQTLPPGQYDANPALVAAIEGASEADLEAAAGDHEAGAMITLAGLDFECVSGTCSVTVAPDGSHFTTTGTIMVMASMDPEPTDPGPTDEEVRDEAMLVLAAIGPDSVRPDADTNADGNQKPFSIDGGEVTESPATPDDMDDDFSEEDTVFWTDDRTGSDVRWTWSYHTRDDGEGVRDSIVNYTDQADPTPTLFAEVEGQTLNARDLDDDVNADGEGSATDDWTALTVTTANAEAGLVVSSSFTSGGAGTLMFDNDDGSTDDMDEAFETTGTYNGAEGTYRCDGSIACTVMLDAEGKVIAVGDDWVFTPDPGARSPVPDADYMDLGFWWQSTTDDEGETTYAILPYAGGTNDEYDVTDVEGTASYLGVSNGVYVTKTFDPVTGKATPNGSGDYYANVELTANFTGTSVAADVHNTITGSVKDFQKDRVDIPGTQEWVLMLDGGTIMADAGTFLGTTTAMNGDIEGEAGTWSGRFHGADDDTNTTPDPFPVSASGIYDGHFNNGHVLGAFGANMVEEDDE